MLTLILAQAARLQLVAVRQSTGQRGNYFRHYLLFLFSFFPPSSMFLIEGVVDPFPDPVDHFGSPWWPFWILQGALQTVSMWLQHR